MGRRIIMIRLTKELTFCIPVRIDSEHRQRNLMGMLNFYSHNLRKAKYLILEADSKPHIDESRFCNKMLKPYLEYCFVKDDNPIFHRTRYINQMLRQANTKVAAVWDTDAIAPPMQVIDAYRAILRGETTMAYPYDGRFWAVNDFFSRRFCEAYKDELLYLTNYPQPLSLMCGYYSVGGAFLVDINKYRHCGWENEHFVGWGPEDAERYRRMELLGHKPLRISGSLYHLYHPRGINSGDYNHHLALSTKKEYCRICGMQPDELRREVAQWEWIK